MTEEEKGRPVFLMEVYQTLCKTSYMPVGPYNVLLMCAMLIAINDEGLINSQATQFSLDVKNQNTPENPTDFEFFSDRLKRKHPSYTADAKTGRILPGPNSPVINFKTLKEIFLSTNLERNEELFDTSGKISQYFDGEDIQGDHIALMSYPRSGNSFLRGYVQKITTIHTGSDIRAHHM